MAGAGTAAWLLVRDAVGHEAEHVDPAHAPEVWLRPRAADDAEIVLAKARCHGATDLRAILRVDDQKRRGVDHAAIGREVPGIERTTRQPGLRGREYREHDEPREHPDRARRGDGERELDDKHD